MRAPTTLALTLGALGACGSEPRAPLLLRLDPPAVIAGAADGERTARSVAHWGPADLLERGRAASGELVLQEGAPDVLRLAGARAVVLTGPFPDEPFDRLVLHVRAPGCTRIPFVAVLEGGQRLEGALPTPRLNRFREVALDLPWSGGAEVRLSRLVLRFSTSRHDPELRSLDLLATPPGERLPLPEAPDLVSLAGTDGRRAVGLVADRPLAVELTPPPGARLAFAVGQRAPVVEPQAVATLVVRLEGEGSAPREERFAIPRGRWEPCSLALDGLGQGPLRAHFALEVPPGAPRAAALALPRIERGGHPAPVLLLVTSDTHRADHVGAAARGVDVRTPVLDALAARGVLFEDCHSTTNVTNPSHISLLTGLAVRDHGVVGNDVPVGGDALTLPEVLAQEGWATYAAVSAVHLGNVSSGLAQGFDRFSAPEDPHRRCAETIADAERWLDEERGVPLFLWLHLYDAHGPYEPPAPYDELYWSAERDPLDPARERDGWRAPPWAESITDPEYVEALYRGEITYLDAELGRLLAHPRLADALVAVVADHGEFLRAGPDDFGHGGLGPGTLDVPLVLAGPGVPTDLRVDRPVSAQDLPRTLLDLVGLHGRPFPGRNLLAQSSARPTRFALSANTLEASVRRGRWMLVLGLYNRGEGGQRQPDHRARLFDTAADPEQRHDLAGEQRALARELRTELVRWLNETGPSVSHGERRADAETLARLEALGYAASEDLPAGRRWFDPDCTCAECARLPLLDR